MNAVAGIYFLLAIRVYLSTVMKQFFIGLVFLILGMHIVWKTEVYFGFFGASEWAERKFGPGGTRTFYKLVGLILVFLGILGATGLLSGFMTGAVGAIFGTRK